MRREISVIYAQSFNRNYVNHGEGQSLFPPKSRRFLEITAPRKEDSLVRSRKKTFEDSLEKLEAITHELEEGDLSLEASLKKFDEGMKLAEFCNKKLDDAQKKINIIMDKDGVPTPAPFDFEKSD